MVAFASAGGEFGLLPAAAGLVAAPDAPGLDVAAPGASGLTESPGALVAPPGAPGPP